MKCRSFFQSMNTIWKYSFDAFRDVDSCCYSMLQVPLKHAATSSSERVPKMFILGDSNKLCSKFRLKSQNTDIVLQVAFNWCTTRWSVGYQKLLIRDQMVDMILLQDEVQLPLFGWKSCITLPLLCRLKVLQTCIGLPQLVCWCELLPTAAGSHCKKPQLIS